MYEKEEKNRGGVEFGMFFVLFCFFLKWEWAIDGAQDENVKREYVR